MSSYSRIRSMAAFFPTLATIRCMVNYSLNGAASVFAHTVGLATVAPN
ncbi:hypothetical protein AYI70_g2020, partial [Smittium culicis]